MNLQLGGIFIAAFSLVFFPAYSHQLSFNEVEHAVSVRYVFVHQAASI